MGRMLGVKNTWQCLHTEEVQVLAVTALQRALTVVLDNLCSKF